MRLMVVWLLAVALAPDPALALGVPVPVPDSPVALTGDATSLERPAPDPASQERASQDTVAPDSIPEPVPVSEAQALLDAETEAELRAVYQRIAGLEGVEVRVEAGVVFLRGEVPTAKDHELARSLAAAPSSVVYVDDRLEEPSSLPSQLGPIRARLNEKFETTASYAPLALVALVILIAFVALGRILARWEAPFRRLTRNPFLQQLLAQTAGAAVALLGFILALELLDATALVGAVLGAAGVVGVAVGFAFRNIAENYLAGILMSLRQPFAPDDWISVEGQEGRVVRLTSRETILMTLDGNHLRIPNATLFNSVVLNYTRNPLRRFTFDLTVGADEELGRALEAGVAHLAQMEGTLGTPPPRGWAWQVGDSWVVLRFLAWIDQTRVEYFTVRSEAIRTTREALAAAGVHMPPPEYGVRLIRGVTPPDEGVPGAPTAGPATLPPEAQPGPDLSPDTSLDEQIQRDREEAEAPDLLHPESAEAPHPAKVDRDA
jgi:small-conductance mechanosensitive channel